MKPDNATRTPAQGPDRAVRAAGDLVGELTHALKNPLAAFTTSLDLLLAGNLDADDVKSLHRVLRNELRKMDEMLGRSRELTRLRQLERQRVDLAALVRARLDLRAADLASANVNLERDVPGGAVFVHGDVTLLEFLFDALVQNALDAMSNGGTMRVRLAVDEGDVRRVVLGVGDTGDGIPEPVRPNVFRLFYTTRAGASGMGLSVAHWIALAHEGDVTLSALEPGTEAQFSMPVE
jgi:signal transduction histidine kinase